MLNSRLTLVRSAFLVVVLAALGCNSSDGEKRACTSLTDCLEGYICMDRVCMSPEELGRRDGGSDDNRPDDPSPISITDAGSQSNDVEFGSYATFSFATSGLAAQDDDSTLVGVTSLPGILGCAMTQDENASPGASAALVVAKLDYSSGDRLCPDGIYAIRNDKEGCKPGFGPQALREGCAYYKAWEGSEQTAFVFATGGVVSITSRYDSATSVTVCEVELQINFDGGSVLHQFTYPRGPADAFCTH